MKVAIALGLAAGIVANIPTPVRAEAFLVYPKERAIIYKNVCAAYKSKHYTIKEMGWYSREWFEKNMPPAPQSKSSDQFMRDFESRQNTSDRASAVITQSHNLLSQVINDRKCDPY